MQNERQKEYRFKQLTIIGIQKHQRHFYAAFLCKVCNKIIKHTEQYNTYITNML